MADYKDLEKTIGYVFKDRNLIITALTHSSYAYEVMAHSKTDKKHKFNERLEFLGDAVLELTSSEFLFGEYPDYPEGKLTTLRASLVCEPTLAQAAREIKLGDYLLLSKGEDHTGGRRRNSILSDAFEALIGAIYLDGGIEKAREFVSKFVLNDIENKHLFYDAKTILQEYLQANDMDNVRYEIAKEEGPAHDKTYTMYAYVGETKVGEGTGQTKKSAQQEAAYRALNYYGVKKA